MALEPAAESFVASSYTEMPSWRTGTLSVPTIGARLALSYQLEMLSMTRGAD